MDCYELVEKLHSENKINSFEKIDLIKSSIFNDRLAGNG
jgi:hypothetical protein